MSLFFVTFTVLPVAGKGIKLKIDSRGVHGFLPISAMLNKVEHTEQRQYCSCIQNCYICSSIARVIPKTLAGSVLMSGIFSSYGKSVVKEGDKLVSVKIVRSKSEILNFLKPKLL